MSENRVHKLSLGYIACLLAVAAVSGCTLEEVTERGDKCPPSGKDAELSYIQMGGMSKCNKGDGCYVEAFVTQECPNSFDGCYYDSSSKFYCMAKCPAGQIACDGACINPETDLKYCGARNTCNDKYGCCSGGRVCDWWETCRGGVCVDTVCVDGKMHCKDGVTYVCQNNTWVKDEECRSNACNEEMTGCSDKILCTYANKTLSDGKKVCSDDGSQLLVCAEGRMEVVEKCELPKICQQLNSVYQCAEPVFKNCEFKDTLVLHGKTVCDGNMLRHCLDGFLDGGQSCPLAGEPEKTVCSVDRCALPEGCALGSESVAHQGLICDDVVLKKCVNGKLELVEDCSSHTDGALFCRKDTCVVPNTCTINGSTVKHGNIVCNDSNSLVKCVDGREEIMTECGETGTCTEDGCIPRYRSIKAIHIDYEKVVDMATCSESGEAAMAADVVVEGVVTAVNGTSGFFIQEVSRNGKQAGAYVSCPKSKKCTTYANGSSMAVGDNVRVTSTALNNYYCQLQIYDPAKDVVVEKTGETTKIEPTVISAADVKDDGAESSHNVYNGSLVRISPLTVHELVTAVIGNKTNEVGWKSLDANAKIAIIGNYLLKQELSVGHHYDVTGVVYYNYNHLLVAPRSKNDVVEVTECSGEESVVKCMKLAGNDQLISCQNGVVDDSKSKNCTKENKVCDSKLEDCRAPVICTDVLGHSIDEGEVGCRSATDLAVCSYDAETKQAVWDRTQTCSEGCNTQNNECFAAAIKSCTFVDLDPETRKGTVDVVVPEGATVSVEIRCAKDVDSGSTYINKWPYAEEASVNSACKDCTTQTQYITAGIGLPKEEDKYVCVAIATVENGKSFVCQTNADAKPVEYTKSTKLNSDGMASATLTYTVSRPLLAYWNFDNKNTNIEPSSIKTNSTFKLANSTGKVEYMEEGSIAAQIGWSKAEEPDFKKDPYWQVVVNTRGYSKITFSYLVKASSTNAKSFQVAYKIGTLDFKPVGKVLKFSDNGGSWKKWSDELPQAAESDEITIGIFPFATSDPKIRIDEVRVTGDVTK